MFLGFINLTQPYYPLAIIVGIVQFAQGFLLRPQPSARKKPQTEKKADAPLFNAEDLSSMMGTQFLYVMPIMTVFISWNLFAGLPIYWITTSVFTIVNQLIMIKLYPVKQIVAADEVFHHDETHEFNPDQPELLESKTEKNITVSVKKRTSKD
jgi:membrane protein insertase Oxa1/YidC/SpoIIIJ